MPSRTGRGRKGKNGSLGGTMLDDLTPKTNEMHTNKMNSREDELGKEFIPDNINLSIIDDIEIKLEDVDFHHNSTAHSDSEGNSDLETVPKIIHVSGSVKAEEKYVNDCSLDPLLIQRDCETCQKYIALLSKHVRDIDIKHEEVDFHNSTADADSEGNPDLEPVPKIIHISGSYRAEEKNVNDSCLIHCQRDCETCEKYIVILTKHVRESHTIPQPTQDNLHIDPAPHQVQQSSSIQSGVDDDIENIEHCESDPDFDLECGGGESGPDYGPSTRLTRSASRQGHLAKSHASRDSITSRAKNWKVTSRKHSKYNECGKSVKQLKIRKETFQCDECGKRFLHSSHLYFHKKIHTYKRYKPHPTQNNLHIHPVPHQVQIKSGVEEGIEHIEHSDQESEYQCESDPEFELASGGESEPDYTPSTRLTRSASRQGQLAKNHSLSESTTSKTKKKKLPSQKHSKCRECGKSVQQLNVHMRIHTGEKPFKCHDCKKRFSQLSYLNVHMRIHTGEKPYKCTACEKSFICSGDLTRHKRVHTGITPFKCDVCEKNFTSSGNLSNHKRIHTGVKPFKCDECDKSFPQFFGLTRHKRSHTQEKPYKCDVCEKRFSQSGHLNIHKRTHTGVKHYKCDDCQKSFSMSHHLVIHKRSHK